MAGGKLVMKVFTIGVGIPVGILMRKATNHAFAAARPDADLREANDAGVAWKDALTWAAISGVGVAASELITRKGAEEAWRFLVGTQPPAPPLSRGQKKALKAQEKAEKQAEKKAEKKALAKSAK